MLKRIINNLRMKLKNKIKIKGKNNVFDKKCLKNLSLRIYGNNNIITIDKDAQINGKIRIFGDNNKVHIGKTGPFPITLAMGIKSNIINNCSFSLGDGSSAASNVNVIMGESDTSVSIGNDCMFSIEVTIFNSDRHAIFDMEGNLINRSHSVEIGNNVWLGRGVSILKNTKIPNNSIVGYLSLVTKKFDEENTAIAGNPAKVIKRNVRWDFERVDVMDERIKQQKLSA